MAISNPLSSIKLAIVRCVHSLVSSLSLSAARFRRLHIPKRSQRSIRPRHSQTIQSAGELHGHWIASHRPGSLSPQRAYNTLLPYLNIVHYEYTTRVWHGGRKRLARPGIGGEPTSPNPVPGPRLTSPSHPFGHWNSALLVIRRALPKMPLLPTSLFRRAPLPPSTHLSLQPVTR